MISEIYRDQINSWHERRLSTLKNDYGWLTLVALEWLREGTNKFAGIGTVTLQGGKVSVQLARGLSGMIAEKPFESGFIRTEADSKGPDRVKVGPRSFVILKRGERFALRIWDTNAEARRRFAGIDRFQISERWRIEATWEEYKKPKTKMVPTAVPKYTEEYKIPGIAVFNVGGTVARLEPLTEEGSEELFFVFSDETSGRETFDAGRYLYAAPPAKGNVVLDFNKAINPPCAFTSFATNPLPPESNRLNIRIEAGEKSYQVR